jgi:dTDP-4-dehydrorhamnose reductase
VLWFNQNLFNRPQAFVFMRILIIGASSYVGSRIYVDLKKKYEVIGTSSSNKLFPELKTLDITNQKDVEDMILTVRPEIIIHAAAMAEPEWCEQNRELAIAINEHGTKHIVDAANKINAKIIYVSSFEVHGGSLYGRTKVASENFVKDTHAGYVILRPSLIVGLSPNVHNDRPFNRILKNIMQHTPAVYETSWKFHPTWLKHIVEVIDVVMTRGIINETIPVAVPELASRFDLAKDILSGLAIPVTSTDDHVDAPLQHENLSKLHELNLPQHSYHEMILGIRKELREYLKKHSL